VRLGWPSWHVPTAGARNWGETVRGESNAQSFAGHLHCCAGHKLAAVEILAPVMPFQSPPGITAGDRGLDNHLVHSGRCHVDPLGDVGDVRFPLVLPQRRKDLRGVPRRRNPFGHGVDAASLCEAMVDYHPSQLRTVLDGLDDRELAAVGEQLGRVDTIG